MSFQWVYYDAAIDIVNVPLYVHAGVHAGIFTFMVSDCTNCQILFAGLLKTCTWLFNALSVTVLWYELKNHELTDVALFDKVKLPDDIVTDQFTKLLDCKRTISAVVAYKSHDKLFAFVNVCSPILIHVEYE